MFSGLWAQGQGPLGPVGQRIPATHRGFAFLFVFFVAFSFIVRFAVSFIVSFSVSLILLFAVSFIVLSVQPEKFISLCSGTWAQGPWVQLAMECQPLIGDLRSHLLFFAFPSIVLFCVLIRCFVCVLIHCCFCLFGWRPSSSCPESFDSSRVSLTLAGVLCLIHCFFAVSFTSLYPVHPKKNDCSVFWDLGPGPMDTVAQLTIECQPLVGDLRSHLLFCCVLIHLFCVLIHCFCVLIHCSFCCPIHCFCCCLLHCSLPCSTPKIDFPVFWAQGPLAQWAHLAIECQPLVGDLRSHSLFLRSHQLFIIFIHCYF